MSPRTYQHKKMELEKWLKLEKAEIRKTEKVLEKGWSKALDSLKRSQRDIDFSTKYVKNIEKFNVENFISEIDKQRDSSEPLKNDVI